MSSGQKINILLCYFFFSGVYYNCIIVAGRRVIFVDIIYIVFLTIIFVSFITGIFVTYYEMKEDKKPPIVSKNNSAIVDDEII